MTNSPSSILRSGFEAAKPRAEKKTTRPQQRRKRPPPFSIRFSDDELTQLRKEAGVLSIAAYIRLKLFTHPEQQGRQRKKLARKNAAPSAELTVISQLLGRFGESELASNMQDIAKAASIGALPVTPELEEELFEACKAIQCMRLDLIKALGVKAK